MSNKALNRLNEEQITCMICSEIYVNPVYCKICKNSFCKGCYTDLKEFNEKHDKNVECPLCKKPLEVERNTVMEDLLKDMIIECKGCTLSFKGYINYVNHKEFCKKIVCKICNCDFKNFRLFVEHFENLELHLNIATYAFDTNSNENIKNEENWNLIYAKEIANLNKNNNNNFVDKYKNREYVNFLDIKEESNFDTAFNLYNESKKPFREFSLTNSFKSLCEDLGKGFINKENREFNDKDLLIPAKCKYYKQYDLFYCLNETNINCTCCPDHICKPGNCLCKDCMTVNLKYHKLKTFFSINKEKRACKYSNKSFHCHYKYLKQNNNRITEFFCHGISPPCQACKELTEIMEYYIKPEHIQKLKMYD
jgi:hypothetical protein